LKGFALPAAGVYYPAFHLGREAASNIEPADFAPHPQHIVRLT
jgi:hypothetical protein